MDASGLVAALRADLAEIDGQIRANTWLADLEAGTLPRAAVRGFAAEQLRIIPSDLRSFEQLAQHSPAEPAHGYLTGMAEGERAALTALEGFATAAGLTEQARRTYRPEPGCQVYPSYVARLARDGTPAEVAGAFLVNLHAWGGCCARMGRALVRHYGMTEPDIIFFALFAGPTDDLERGSIAVIDAGLAEGVDPDRIAEAARLLQAYELLYWTSLPR